MLFFLKHTRKKLRSSNYRYFPSRFLDHNGIKNLYHVSELTIDEDNKYLKIKKQKFPSIVENFHADRLLEITYDVKLTFGICTI